MLTFRPEDRLELHRAADAAGYRRLPPFIMDLIKGMPPRPAAHVETLIRTSYHVQVLSRDPLMIMQAAVDRWTDGRTVVRYTGVQYPDEATGREECERLNAAPRG